MLRKRLNVTFVPDGGAVRTLRVPLTLLMGLVVFLVSGVAMVAGSGLVLLKGIAQKQDVRRLKSENTRLRDHLERTDHQLGEVEQLVHASESLEQRARLLAGLDPVDDETRQLGVGGPFVSLYTAELNDRKLTNDLESQGRRIDELIRRASFQRESYLETIESLERQQERLSRTPTISPLKGDYPITSGFGPRPDPFTGRRGVHNGLDLRAPTGTPVYATGGGTVATVGRDGEFGLCVRIDHGDGIETAYCHLSRTEVQPGGAVQRGVLIGAVGTSGRSTGSHLHYEVQVSGIARNPAHFILNPTSVVD